MGTRDEADAHEDASDPNFASKFVAGACQAQKPDWVVTSPHYKSAVSLVRSALPVCSTALVRLGTGAGVLAPGSVAGSVSSNGMYFS